MRTVNLDLSLANRFACLGEQFYSKVNPTPFETASRLVHFNEQAASLLDLKRYENNASEVDAVLCGAALPEQATPYAMLYAGHQFGHFVPQLGDGRAITIAEIYNHAGALWEIQLKGSGLTPYSRDGDGRAVLRSSIREYLASEAMQGLGIPTTRALSLYVSDDEVYRETIEPGAVLARLAPSHVRFGSFEVFYYRNQFEQIKQLADFVIAHHYPDLSESDSPYVDLLRQVTQRTARLIAQWQSVGFCHGVMNSDNMSILGLTLDYGPYGFLDAFDPHHVCNHSDYQGRYAYDQQPKIGLFNLSCLAQALLPLFDEEPENAAHKAREVLETYYDSYQTAYLELMRAKLGLQKSEETDAVLIADLLDLMASDKVDFTILFRTLSAPTSQAATHPARDLFLQREQFDQWYTRYQARLETEDSSKALRMQAMQAVNPKFILRNYLAESAIRKAEDEQDYSEVDRLFNILSSPFDEHPDFETYAGFPPDWATKISVSCSS